MPLTSIRVENIWTLDVELGTMTIYHKVETIAEVVERRKNKDKKKETNEKRSILTRKS